MAPSRLAPLLVLSSVEDEGRGQLLMTMSSISDRSLKRLCHRHRKVYDSSDVSMSLLLANSDNRPSLSKSASKTL